MTLAKRSLLVCNCEGTMEIDGPKLAKALGLDDVKVHSHLCRSEIDAFAKALDGDEPVLVACTQEAPLFRELAEEAGTEKALDFTNIRERAGWCARKKGVTAKMAALLAEAALDIRPAGTVTLKSDGVCLVYGDGQAALDAGRQLSGRLNVSVLLRDAGDALPPSVAEVPVYGGQIAAASGHFGNFEVVVNQYAPIVPSSKADVQFVMPRDGASATCGLILDISGGAPLFPGHERREGYFHVDPKKPGAVAEAMFALSDLVGEFDKPIYVRHDPEICAHSRNQKIGCRRCLDICPASAIAPAGDVVAIDTTLCGGCGSCHSVCPTGAAAYQYPARDDLVLRIQTLAETYLAAKGKRPVLLAHNERRGAETIGAMARFGKGLPEHVIPLSLNEVTSLGHDALASALASGFEQIVVLAHGEQRDEISGLEEQVELMNAFMKAFGHKGRRVTLMVEDDPDLVETALYGLPELAKLKPGKFSPVMNKRELARLALLHLNDTAPKAQDLIKLPDGAPYGSIQIDTDSCTMCLSCVSACPANALQDNPDHPQVRFIEQACVQCGLCRTTCPESVITLTPRFNFKAEAMTPQLLNEEEPFDCIRCGTPFGSRSTIERISEKLAGKHAMFQTAEAQSLIKMCDNCRIISQAEAGNDPMAMGERPKVRTTEDYMTAEAAIRNGGNGSSKADDFLKDD